MTATLTTATVASAAIWLNAIALLAQDGTTIRPVPQTRWESCDEMHDYYVRRFESSPGFGMSRMAQPLMLDRSGVLDLGRMSYAVQSVELVGLLHRSTPVVYVPMMHGTKIDPSFESRDLTDFEKNSLDAFLGGSDIASTGGDKAGRLRCTGTLRAKASCLGCHKSKKAGDLLGAFTYTLRSVPQQPE